MCKRKNNFQSKIDYFIQELANSYPRQDISTGIAYIIPKDPHISTYELHHMVPYDLYSINTHGNKRGFRKYRSTYGYSCVIGIYAHNRLV